MATATKIGTKKWLCFRCYEQALDGTKTLTDPTLLTVTVKPRVAAANVQVWPTDGTIVKQSTGVFVAYYTTAESDVHQVRAAATGAIVVAEQTSFTVAASNIA